jgi:hypothetical protein
VNLRKEGEDRVTSERKVNLRKEGEDRVTSERKVKTGSHQKGR